MAANVLVREPVESDIDGLMADLRPADRDELVASSGGADLRWQVQSSLRMSRFAWAFEIDGNLACLAGVVAPSLLSTTGVPWMLGTTVLDKNVGTFIRNSKPYYAEVKAKYPYLVNFVDARNVKSVRWLKWLGFEVHDAEPMGALGLPFHKFETRS